MPAFSFYALRPDLPGLLDFVFARTDCRVYEAYSVPDRLLRGFASTAEALAAYPPTDAEVRDQAVGLVLWSPGTGGGVRIRRFELKPGAVPGATHRQVAEGWGLIQLYVGGISGRGINASHLSHNSLARARAWEDTYADLFGPVDAWDWDAVEKLSRKLCYHVRTRLAVGKHGSRPVLAAAAAKLEEGYELRP